ncbi:MAG: hypothetical protein ACI8PD_000967 [Nitrospinales bacterium]|jgi:hypothetical protein
MQVPSFDELDAVQLKELIQSSKKPAKKSKKLPLQEEKANEKSQSGTEKSEVFL